MNLNKDNINKILGIITFTVLLFVGVQNLDLLLKFFSNMFKLFFPFILGAAIAFVLNVPMREMEKGAEFTLKTKKGNRKLVLKLNRPFSLLLTLFLVIGVIVFVVFLIFPEIGKTIEIIADSKKIEAFLSEVEKKYTELVKQYPDVSDYIYVNLNWKQMGENIINFVQNSGSRMLQSTVGIAASIVGGLFNFFLGLIFSIYILLQKEKLGNQSKKLIYAYLPERAADKLIAISSLSSVTFSKFLSGQCLEAVILGSMFFLAMSIFGFPYAIMISVFIGFTALIPVFGAFIGCLVGVFLILIVNPLQALWFLILFLILQQIEGNFIYPHVVGGSVGLPSIWVLAAVTIGGSTMGVAGMFIFIPMVSVIYTLLRDAVYERLKEKKLLSDKVN